MSKRSQAELGATSSGLRLADYPVGSAQSRAAARRLADARTRSESDGKLGWLADRIRAARMKARTGEMCDSLSAIDGWHGSNGERRPDCLLERIRKARERVGRTFSPETMR
jgi:hypothetical protein